MFEFATEKSQISNLKSQISKDDIRRVFQKEENRPGSFGKG